QQQHQQPHPKGTPARRRANRNHPQYPAHKTYASENDMPSELPFPIDLASPGPFTPQKFAVGDSPGPSSQLNSAKSRPQQPRSTNKPRQKHGPTSPAPAKQGRHTPPQSSLPKAVTAAAFAGATFHASPAPSSLPIPSFLGKALDSPSVKDSDRASQEPSPPATDSEAPTPKHRLSTLTINREESPLDVFFRADRAEKERARRASSANIFNSVPRPFSPPKYIQPPQEPRTVPSGLGAYRTRQPTAQSQRNSASHISFTELDGNPGKPMGPAFSTPYQDRIRAARSSEKQGETVEKMNVPQQQQETPADRSRKLMDFLSIP
ncbi:hypothetical protein B0T17DRAFT_474768, partial [Bombardia bombarda]